MRDPLRIKSRYCQQQICLHISSRKYERLVVQQTFVDGLRDHGKQRSLRLACHKTLVADKGYAGGYSKIRTMKKEKEETKFDLT